jgi:hypothetical protein
MIIDKEGFERSVNSILQSVGVNLDESHWPRLMEGLLRAIEREPIPLRLDCPACGELHIDAGEFATKPHHTHACQECGAVWRPAVVHTVGVRFLPGFKDETR